MGEGTSIQWADDTHNFWRICTKVSPGCKNCYAETLLKNRRGEKWGKGAPRIRLKAFDAPIRWNKKPWVCDLCGSRSAANRRDNGSCLNPLCPYRDGSAGSFHRRRVFSLSLGDWLDEEVPIEWLADMLNVIHQCPNLDFLLLTKRPENWSPRMESIRLHGLDQKWVSTKWDMENQPPHNVWIGVSVEDQQRADERIPQLLKIPARIRFLSVEPLLGPVRLDFEWRNDLQRWDSAGRELEPRRIDWVIVGGESGPGARPCKVDWIRSVRDQCKAAGVPMFVKQLGSNPHRNGEDESETTILLDHKKGGDISEWAEDLRIREFPYQPMRDANPRHLRVTSGEAMVRGRSACAGNLIDGDSLDHGGRAPKAENL
ncbi:MAG TPA: DUF5131 family protein [Candidatus Binatia bacterium]|nr:DUF5131 family protein [Candidatus Binatia bacterium]